AVYTNNPFGGRFRAFNTVPQRFGFEAHIDRMATMIGLDPLELRLRNAHKSGDNIFGLRLGSCGLIDCINRAANLMGWKEKKRAKTPYHGLGMGCMTHPGSGGRGEFSGAFVKLEDDGMVTVLTGATEIGGGQDTLVAQIAAEVLGTKIEKVRVVGMDTEVTPIDFGSRASRSTFMVGNAVKAAAGDARRQLLQRAAERLEARADDLEIKDGMIYVKGASEKTKSIGDILLASTSPKPAGKGGPYLSHPVYGRGTFVRDKITTRVAAFAAQAVEVEVDPSTGAIKILKFIAAHDVGRAINLLGTEGQIEGGVSQGIGYGLTEELQREGGKNINGNLMDYKLPCAADMPPVEACIIESDEPEGPFGAKGIGEPPSVPTAPSIANAVYDAIGIMIKELPITPEKVLNALKEKERSKTLPPPSAP
ncbi:MAG: molybdopterin cofactor-binding domain-containing protein, partial [Thermodesulfobacteriota bacterium]